MPIPQTTRDYIETLVDYYVNVASSYKQIAQLFGPDIVDINDTTLGIIVGAVYSGFLQTYANQKQKVSLEDINEFNDIIKRRAPGIKKAVVDAKT
jgi:hypothetical protein